jgi:hypothetical protein
MFSWPWQMGMWSKCHIAIPSSFLFTVPTGPQRASSSPLSSTLSQSYCSKWPPHTSPSNGTWQHPHHSNFHPTYEAESSSVTHLSTYKPTALQPRKPYLDTHYSKNFKSHILNLFSLWDRKSSFTPIPPSLSLSGPEVTCPWHKQPYQEWIMVINPQPVWAWKWHLTLAT